MEAAILLKLITSLEEKDARGTWLMWLFQAPRQGEILSRSLLSFSLPSSAQDLYLLIMKDESLYQDLREDTLRLHQLVETVELK